MTRTGVRSDSCEDEAVTIPAHGSVFTDGWWVGWLSTGATETATP